MKKTWKHGTIGSVSEGTMRNQDLIPAFCEELRYLGHRSSLLTRIEHRFSKAINGERGENDEYFTDDMASFDIDSLFSMLESHALPYMYFGSHPGDGADYGFWVSDFLDADFDGLKVGDLNDIPAKYTGDVLEINERGNVILYACKRGKLREIWAVV